MASSYVHVRRSETTRQRPFLDIDPVNISLTEGTDIPAPPPEADITPKVPELPTLRAPTQEERQSEKPRSASRHSGPLSSHPVTPTDGGTGEPGRSAFPFEQQSGAYINRIGRPGTASSAPLNQTLRSKASAGGDISSAKYQYNNNSSGHQSSGAMNPPPQKGFQKGEGLPPYQEPSSSRRPSFASRFLRFRSFSSLRSRNASSSTLTPDNSHSQLYSAATSARPSTDALNATGPRGQKRPGSPSIFATSSIGPGGAASNGDNRGIQSFPRMVRKKSMDLFGSARRRSGMWGRSGDEISAMEEEAAREREREAMEQQECDEQDAQQTLSRTDTAMTNGDRSSTRVETNSMADQGMSDVQRSLSGRTESVHSPAPVLPEMDESFGKSLQGESMFANIGRD